MRYRSNWKRQWPARGGVEIGVVCAVGGSAQVPLRAINSIKTFVGTTVNFSRLIEGCRKLTGKRTLVRLFYVLSPI